MTRRLRPALVCLVIAGCTDSSYILVTVDGRPAVHDVDTLHVTLTNDGAERSDDLTVSGKAFPVTFSISAPGRSGELDIAIDAIDVNGLAIGHGSVASAVGMSSAEILIDSADFVVNTDFAGDQFLSSDFEANGNQLAATTSGTWMAVFRDGCAAPCNMSGRRFNPTGAAVSSQIAAGANEFPISTTLTTATSTPAVAASGTTTLAFWDFAGTDSSQGIACRSIDQNGSPSGDQVLVALDSLADVVSATPLSDGNFAVTWQSTNAPTDIVRGAIVTPACAPLGAIASVVTSTTSFPHRPAVAASGSNVMYAWIDDGNVHTRMADNTNTFTSADTVVIPKAATEEVEHVRLTSFGAGFAVVVRWAPLVGTGAGRIELYQGTATGTLSGAPLVVTGLSGGDTASVQSFGVATAADSSVMVVWAACGANGDGSGCGVFGQLVSPAQALVGNVISVATSTMGDQTAPSVTAIAGAFVVAWNDASATEPDTSGLAVRARIVYPPTM